MPPPPLPDGGYGGQPPASTGSAIGALIANIVGIFACFPFALIGIILAIIGLATASGNPGSARGCTLAAWIMFGVSAVIGIGWLLWYVLVLGAAVTSP